MERLFLCCFRSCLKGDDDKEYYTILDIEDPYRATTEQIKRQYKKLSLNLHPDKLAQRGVQVTQEHRQQFIRLKDAYDVLSDPKRRRLYDEYGLTGLKLMENPTEVDHTQLLKNFQKNRGDRTTIGLAIAGVFAFLLVLPILFSLKCDGTLNHDAKWVAIWTPMWIIDILLLVSAGLILTDKGSKNHGEDAHPEDDPSSPNSDKIPLHEKLINLFSTLLFILIQIFILIRLDGDTDWSWFAVFAPWFAYEGLAILAALPKAFLQKLTPPNHDLQKVAGDEESQNNQNDEEATMAKLQAESEYFEKLLEQDRERRYIIIHLLRIWLAIFLALQLDNIVNWNWGLVLLPIWIYLFIHYIYAFIYRLWANHKLNGINLDELELGLAQDPIDVIHVQQSSTLSSSAVYLCFAQAVPLFMAIMLVCRLQAGSYSTFLIILPIFIIIGCCCCLVFCGLIGMSVVDTEALDEEIANQQRQQGGGAASGTGEPGGSEKEVTTIYSPPPVNDPKYGTFRPDEVQSSPLQETELNVKSEGNVGNSPSASFHGAGDRIKDSEKEKLVSETTIDVDID